MESPLIHDNQHGPRGPAIRKGHQFVECHVQILEYPLDQGKFDVFSTIDGCHDPNRVFKRWRFKGWVFPEVGILHGMTRWFQWFWGAWCWCSCLWGKISNLTSIIFRCGGSTNADSKILQPLVPGSMVSGWKVYRICFFMDNTFTVTYTRE